MYLEDIQDVYSEVMATLHKNPKTGKMDQVTYNTLRKFKHLTVSLSFNAVSEVCQQAFDHPDTDFDEWCARSPRARLPGHHHAATHQPLAHPRVCPTPLQARGGARRSTRLDVHSRRLRVHAVPPPLTLLAPLAPRVGRGPSAAIAG